MRSSPVRSLRKVATLTAGQVALGLAHVLQQLQQADDATQRQLEAEGKRKQKVHAPATQLSLGTSSLPLR